MQPYPKQKLLLELEYLIQIECCIFQLFKSMLVWPQFKTFKTFFSYHWIFKWLGWFCKNFSLAFSLVWFDWQSGSWPFFPPVYQCQCWFFTMEIIETLRTFFENINYNSIMSKRYIIIILTTLFLFFLPTFLPIARFQARQLLKPFDKLI